ncbi:MAG TPA: hypothetical protein VMV19_16715 [Xanthobacteraceae bacterium]|nr:hypothetical protein [Xanthobacteraceae bacterium]
MPLSDRATENDVAFAVAQIAKTKPNDTATFDQCREEVPDYLNLSAADLAQSPTRPNEKVWEQQIRNIQSHHDNPGNYICEGYLIHVPKVGYRVTETGKARVHP